MDHQRVEISSNRNTCFSIGMKNFTGGNTRDERRSTYLSLYQSSSVYPLAETSLHSRLNGWIATQLFTILPLSHSPTYLSRPIHRSMLGWNASIPIPSFMISGPSRYEIFPVQKHIHAEYSSTFFPSPIFRGRNSQKRIEGHFVISGGACVIQILLYANVLAFKRRVRGGEVKQSISAYAMVHEYRWFERKNSSIKQKSSLPLIYDTTAATSFAIGDKLLTKKILLDSTWDQLV